MKKFILNSIVFLSLVFLIVKVTGLFDNRDMAYTTNGDAMKAIKMDEFDSLDILFVGNSYCYSSIATPLFDSMGLRVFNLGIATAGVEFYSLVLEEYLQSVTKKPGKVYLLVSPMTYSSEADNWLAHPIHRYVAHPLSNEKLVNKYKIYQDYFPLILNSGRKGLTNLFAAAKKNEADDYDYVYKNLGFYIDSTVTSDKIEKNIESYYEPLREEKFNPALPLKMIELAEKLKAEGIEVIFFETPTYRLNEYFSPEYITAYEKSVAHIQAKYYLKRKPLDFGREYFRNIDHTNAQGAYHFTEYLMNQSQKKL